MRLGKNLAGISIVILSVTISNAALTPVNTSPRAEFFEKKIRPVLLENCYKCHAPGGSSKVKGGLSIVSREAMLKGGEHGPAIVPGHPEKSRLIEAVRWATSELQMPPKTQLPEATVRDLTTWVQMGAPWGGGDLKGTGGPALANYDKLRQSHWAWQPVRTVAPPAVHNPAWPLCDIDKFVLAKMEERGLHPVGQADKYELLRRVTFDLTGLPPTLTEIDAFVADNSPNAYAKVVDRLLASSSFGERWGRHWLDVARYAESTGSTRNHTYDYAWRYRDYVIDSFNADKPYSQFVTEQVAGDLLPFKSVKQHNEQRVATGFLAMGIKDLNEKDATKFMMDNVDEQIDTVGKAVLGLTISCARCHDHKFDPIPQADYYKMAGIFRSTEILSGLTSRKGGGKKQATNENLLVRLDPVPADAKDPVALAARQQEIEELSSRLDDAKGDAKKGGKAAGKKRAKAQNAAKSEVKNLQAEIATIEHGSALALGVTEQTPSNSPIYQQGNVESPGPTVPRGTITLCKSVYNASVPTNHSGRLELARWMTSRDNPLGTRVIANRIWHHLFGEGLVRTVDNFGTTGEAPTHPELLDYLATRFAVTDNGSFKKMIRELVLTRTYQMAGTWDAADGAVDPADRFLWRMAPRRLEAEEIRDAILVSAGKLDTRRPTGSPVVTVSGQLNNLDVDNLVRGRLETSRSVYLPVIREYLPIALDKFDFANPEMTNGDREVTTVAPQALFMMNDSFVIEQSQHMAQRVLEHDWMDQPTKIDAAYRIAFGRPATPAEKQRAQQYLTSFGTETASKNEPPRSWTSLCQALMASAEFRYLN